MFACVVYTMVGHSWLQHSIYDKNIDIELHAQVLTLGQNMVVKSEHHDRLLIKNNFHFESINDKHQAT